MAACLYDITKETLGKGHFAVVKLAKHCLTGELVAVKIIDKARLKDDSLQKLGLEIKLLSRLSEKAHPNIVKLYQVIDTKTKLYLVMEYAGKEVYDLSDFIEKNGRLKESEARHIFKQVCSAIDYCHSLRIVHRDLKPENILIVTGPSDSSSSSTIDYPLVKLIDFGLSNQWDEGEKLRTSCGSLAYSPPEVLLGDDYNADKVDIWSLGCILYFLFYGNNPFWRKNDNETLTRIMDCKFSTPRRSFTSESSIHLIKSLLRKDPSTRLTLKEIFNHPWLSEEEEENHLPELIEEKKSPNISRNVKILHEKVIDLMISKEMCKSKDQVENALSSKNNRKDIKGELTINENDGKVYQDNYLTATYHLLKDKLAREIHINNSLSKRVCSNQWRQTHPRLRPFGFTPKEFSEERRSGPLDISPEEEGGFSMPLARKCSIVSEEGSCAETSINDSGSERLTDDFELIKSKPSVDIVITDFSGCEDLPSENSGLIPEPPSSGLHLVSSSPELLREEDYKGIDPIILDSSREVNDVITSFAQKSTDSNSFTTTSMRIIIQSKSCNNILMSEERTENEGKEKNSKTECKRTGRFFFKSKNDKADCCNIC